MCYELTTWGAVGSRDILYKLPIAFFCSVRCPGNLILKSYDLAQKWRAEGQPVIGGFHSPVEKEVLRIMLRSTVPVCIVLARSLPQRIPSEYRKPIEQGRLLLLSPFNGRIKRATQESAVQRNRVVAGLAEKVFVAYATVGSKTEAFCQALAGSGKVWMTFDDPETQNVRLAGCRVISL